MTISPERGDRSSENTLALGFGRFSRPVGTLTLRVDSRHWKCRAYVTTSLPGLQTPVPERENRFWTLVPGPRFLLDAGEPSRYCLYSNDFHQAYWISGALDLRSRDQLSSCGPTAGQPVSGSRHRDPAIGR